MIRTVIIDDEPLIREGLSVVIDWERLGYEIVGTADNGYNGYNTIIETKAEVAIVDIMMPDMTGLELVELLKKDNVNCKIIFLTAYADFEYAKKSIELDVCYYLMKPLEEKELEDKLQIISDIIKKEKRNTILTNEKILEKLVHGDKDIIEGINSGQFDSININWDSFRLAVIQAEETDSKELYNNYAALDLGDTADKYYKGTYVFRLDGNIGILLHEENESKIFRAVTILQKHIKRTYNITPYIYVGDAVNTIDEIANTYTIIKKYMQNRFLYGYKQIVLAKADEFKKTEDDIAVRKIRAADLYDAVCLNNIKAINTMLDDYREYFIHNRCNEEYIKLSYYNLYKDVYVLICNRIPEIAEASSEETDLLSQFTMMNSLQELHGFIKYKILLLSEKISSINLNTPIKKIIDYIDRNLDQDLKIEKLAELMHYSCSHMGKMIKEELGENFNSYLNRKRIEKAKELLQQDIKISEVAEKVGYKNSNLFFTYFKKINGCTPLEYKKSITE
ncbi:MAG TPA: response regulator [Clostridiales bacterium]|nr:response regulator [Clostridiales bacterium]